jgi:hypothetical protein
VLQGETVQVCCPTGYTCLLNDPYSYSKCVATTDTSRRAFALQVRWQESDLSILATDPTVPGSTYSAASTATATPGSSGGNTDAPTSSPSTTAAQNDDPGSGSDGGIPSGTIIGIAIGVGGMVAAFAVSALGFFIWRHRRKKRENTVTDKGTRNESMISGLGGSKPEPEPEPGGGFAPENQAELDSRARANTFSSPSEVSAERNPVEMPPSHIAATEMEVPHFVAELPGSMPEGHDGDLDRDAGSPSGANPPRSPLPTAETSQRESGALGHAGHWKRRSVARSQSQLRPVSRSSTSTSSTAAAPTIENYRPSPI